MTNSLGDLADGGSVSVCDRNTKKVRFKDRNSDLDSEMANGVNPTPTLSWKEMLLGKGSHDQQGEKGGAFFRNG